MPETVVLQRDKFVYIQRGMEWVDLSALIFSTFPYGHSNSAGNMYFTYLPKENKLNYKNQLKFIVVQCKSNEEAMSMELNDSSTEGR